jgi:hypothetical protein
MSRIAKLTDGVAVDFRIPSEFTPPEGETWVDVPDYVQRGSSLVDGVWAKPDGQPYTLADYAAPITKLTLKTRVTPQEWGAIKAAIAGAGAETQEDWELAKEIDPAHPQTAGMIAALQDAGYLTTPLHVIFAP